MSADPIRASLEPLAVSALGETLAYAHQVEVAARAIARALVERFADTCIATVVCRDEGPLRVLAERTTSGPPACRAISADADVAELQDGARLAREICYGGERLGRLIVARRASRFSAEEVAALDHWCLELGSHVSNTVLRSAGIRAAVNASALAELAAALARTATAVGVLDVTLRRLARTLSAAAGVSYLACDGERWRTVSSLGSGRAAGAVPVEEDPAFALALEGCRPIFLEDRAGPAESRVVVPLFSAGSGAWGMVELLFGHLRSFSVSERNFVDAAGAIAGLSLERARSYERERIERFRAESLRDVSSALLAANSEQDVVRAIVQGLRLLGTRFAVDTARATGLRFASQGASSLRVAGHSASIAMIGDDGCNEGTMQIGFAETRVLTASERSYLQELGVAGARGLAKVRASASARGFAERAASIPPATSDWGQEPRTADASGQDATGVGQ